MDGTTQVSDAIAQILTRLEEAWFGPKSEDWSELQRFLCAWAGSMTFFGVVILVELKTWAVDLSTDETLRNAFISAATIMLVVAAGWFAWLVSRRNTQFGATRLYLSGLLLPGLVWIFVENALF